MNKNIKNLKLTYCTYKITKCVFWAISLLVIGGVCSELLVFLQPLRVASSAATICVFILAYPFCFYSFQLALLLSDWIFRKRINITTDESTFSLQINQKKLQFKKKTIYTILIRQNKLPFLPRTKLLLQIGNKSFQFFGSSQEIQLFAQALKDLQAEVENTIDGTALILNKPVLLQKPEKSQFAALRIGSLILTPILAFGWLLIGMTVLEILKIDINNPPGLYLMTINFALSLFLALWMILYLSINSTIYQKSKNMSLFKTKSGLTLQLNDQTIVIPNDSSIEYDQIKSSPLQPVQFQQYLQLTFKHQQFSFSTAKREDLPVLDDLKQKMISSQKQAVKKDQILKEMFLKKQTLETNAAKSKNTVLPQIKRIFEEQKLSVTSQPFLKSFSAYAVGTVFTLGSLIFFNLGESLTEKFFLHYSFILFLVAAFFFVMYRFVYLKKVTLIDKNQSFELRINERNYSFPKTAIKNVTVTEKENTKSQLNNSILVTLEFGTHLFQFSASTFAKNSRQTLLLLADAFSQWQTTQLTEPETYQTKFSKKWAIVGVIILAILMFQPLDMMSYFSRPASTQQLLTHVLVSEDLDGNIKKITGRNFFDQPIRLSGGQLEQYIKQPNKVLSLKPVFSVYFSWRTFILFFGLILFTAFYFLIPTKKKKYWILCSWLIILFPLIYSNKNIQIFSSLLSEEKTAETFTAVVDAKQKRESHGKRKRTDYYLIFSSPVKTNASVYFRKEVRSSTYDRYHKGEQLSVSTLPNSPHSVILTEEIDNPTLLGTISIFIRNNLFLIGVLVILLPATLLLFKKEKT